MGEVFKARDTRLERSVAIKVLPAEFSNNAQLKLRFEREAKTISQLSHPNICTLYDVGDNYLVMELLDGETLAERIAKGPVPLDQIIRIGTEIANALERAHRAGVVHRDLKPSNVMLTKSGAKLLDFGLARESAVLGPGSSVEETVRKPLTEEGAIVGTMQYMAPEQLEGGEVDARTDIFALGAVLYEMATGKRAFDGKSKASVIANILGADPQPITAWQPTSPAALDRLIRTCLSKDPDERWQNAHDVAIELRGVKDTVAPTPQRSSQRMSRMTTVALALTTLALASTLVWKSLNRAPAVPVRTYVLPPDKMEFDFLSAGAPPAISPDGSRIVFGASEVGKTRLLYVRSLDSLIPQPIAGTERAAFPFWSPDGRYVAFFVDNLLKKIDVNGGAAVTLCNAADGRGGSWSKDGTTIIFAGRFTSIHRVPAVGGAPVEVTKLAPNENTHRFPEFLPDNRHFLFLSSPSGPENPSNAICVGSIDGAPHKRLIASANEPHYVGGAILFARDHILTAQAFDLKTLTLTGDAVPLREQRVESTPLFSRSVVTVSPNGTLVYEVGEGAKNTRLVWMDRAGKVLAPVAAEAPYAQARISPDGKLVATSFQPGPQANIWLFDLRRGTRSRISFGPGPDTSPIWSPDGHRIVYTVMADGKVSLVMKDLTTGALDQLATFSDLAQIPSATSWSHDGQRLLFSMGGRVTRADIYWMSLADRVTHLYLATPALEQAAQFSPDDKWIAYTSNEAGNIDVYVAPFPPTGAKWQVSTNGGGSPRWRADGKELFYYDGPSSTLFSVPIALGSTPEIGTPVILTKFRTGLQGVNAFDVTPDGQRILANTEIGEQSAPAPLIVVQHFDEELREALGRH